MIEENITLTVITVCFNSEKTIKFTLESVLNQTYSNIEYIIVDGKSTDATLDIIKLYETKFRKKGISYKWISEVDEGVYDAMNKGIKLSKGKLIGLLNSDDWYEVDALQNVKDQYIKYNADFIHGNLNLYSLEKKFRKTLKPKNKKVVVRKMPFFHPTSFVSKKIYNKLKGYSLDYKICADYDFIIKIIHNKFKICYIDKVITNFTIGGISTTQVREALKESHLIRINNGHQKGLSKFYYYLETLICKIKYR